MGRATVDRGLVISLNERQKLTQNSWFTVRQTIPKPTPKSLSTTSLPLPPSLWRAITAKDPPTTAVDANLNDKPGKEQEKPTPVKARRIRIYPTLQQQQTIKEWIGAVRWTYNQSVNFLNDEQTKGKRTIKDLRARSVNNDVTEKAWTSTIPYDVRDEGARDAKKAIASNMAKQRIRKAQGLKHSFRLDYRRKKFSSQETIAIHSKHWRKTRGLYFDLLGSSGTKLKASEPLPIDLVYDSRPIRTRLNEYYLCIPMGGGPAIDNQDPDPASPCVIALDPGVRTFMTGYDASGRIIEWGPSDTTRIHRLCKCLDSLLARCKLANHSRRYKMRRAALRIRRRIRNLVDDLHRKLAKWLCQSYRVVLIPLFETQQMVKKKGGHRRLHSKTARAMCTWSHYRFRQHLISKAREYPHVRIQETTESTQARRAVVVGYRTTSLGG